MISIYISTFTLQTKQAIMDSNKAGKPVAGIIIEPIQAEGGEIRGSVLRSFNFKVVKSWLS